MKNLLFILVLVIGFSKSLIGQQKTPKSIESVNKSSISSYKEQGIIPENRYDAKEKKHGYWQQKKYGYTDEQEIVLYHHGVQVGYIETEYGYEVKDTLGKVIASYEAKPFDNLSDDVQVEVKFENGRYVKSTFYRDKAGTINLWKLDSLKEKLSSFEFSSSNENERYRTFMIKDGSQIEMLEKKSVLQKQISKYDDNVLQSVVIYYPNSESIYCEVLCKTVVSKLKADGKSEFPGQTEFGTADKITYYHANGSLMMTFNADLFNIWDNKGIIKNRGTSSLIIPIVDYIPTIANFPKIIGFATQFIPDECYGCIEHKSLQSIVKDTVIVTLNDSNGGKMTDFVFLKTNSTTKGYLGKNEYGLHGTYIKDGIQVKYYKGLQDSVWINKTGNEKIISFYDKGTLIMKETYSLCLDKQSNYSKCVTQSLYNELGQLHGSQKTFFTVTDELYEIIYENGKKVAEPPMKVEKFISLFEAKKKF